jgi:hypothetical protein
MQGKLIIGAFLLSASSGAFAAEPIKRVGCPKTEQPQARQQPTQQQQQPQRAKSQGCPVSRTIPPVVDPTPTFLL